MKNHKQPILHELLQQDQEPFHLKSYISDKRSHLNYPSPPAAVPEPRTVAFLRVPPMTAAVLLEAAMRIQKQPQSKPKTQIKNAGLSLFGSFLKILKHRSRNRVVRNCDSEERENPDAIRISCRGLCRDDLRASSFHDTEARNCSSPISPFVFSPRISPSFSGRRTPEYSCSPAAATSPIPRVKQEKEHSAAGVEEEKEQCSPVSVLDTFFEYDEHESLVGEEEEEKEEDHDRYANIERARQQLLERLERFEKLAALDQVDLEEKLLEASEKIVEFEQDHLILDKSSLKQSPKKMCAEMKRLTGEDECQVVLRRSWHLPRQAEFGPIGVIVELDEWGRWSEVVEETAAEMEAQILGSLMEECFAWIH